MKVFGHAPGTKPSSFILVGAASGRRSPPVVADHLEREEHVFHLRAAADVVDGVVAGRAGDDAGGNDADVIEAAGEAPGDDVAGLEGAVDFPAAAGEEGHEVRNAAVVDVRVGSAQAPHARVGAEVPAHVFVDLPPEGDAGGAGGAADDRPAAPA